MKDPIIFKKYTIAFFISFIINCLVFPAMFFQMYKTFQSKQAKDFNPFFILLQLLGGAPEGMVGSILGYLNNNKQMLLIGLYAMFYNSFMLFFRLFGINGLIKSIF